MMTGLLVMTPAELMPRLTKMGDPTIPGFFVLAGLETPLGTELIMYRPAINLTWRVPRKVECLTCMVGRKCPGRSFREAETRN